MAATDAQGRAAKEPPAPRSDRLVRALLSTPCLGAVLAALTWPIDSIGPSTGPDPSWLAGLYMATERGLRFGTEVVFTYGPLGFLERPALYGEALFLLSFAYQACLHLALAMALIWVGRRGLPLALALAATYLVLVVGYLEAASMLLAFTCCLALLQPRPPRAALPLVIYGGGALGAIELLGKANFGLAVLALCALTLLATPRRWHNLARFAAVAATTLFALWLLGGQSLWDLPDFLANTASLVSGYSGAMGADLGTMRWSVSLAVAAAALLVAAAALAGREGPRARRLALPALAALYAFLAFKQDFVRQTPATRTQFFVLALGAGVALAAVLGPSLRARGPALRAAATGALLAPLLALLVLAHPGASFWQALRPGDHVEYLRDDLRAFLSPGDRDRLRGQGREGMRNAYALDRRTLALLGDRPVHVDPWEIGVAWAYSLNWQPLPVIQDYVAYTPRLDRLNADALAAADGPEAILRQNTRALGAAESTVDARYPGWESPAAKLAMLCHYQPLRTTGRWQLLERSPGRCGPPRPLAVVEAASGKPVAVPAPGPGEVVFARVEGLGVDGLEALRSLAYRARARGAELRPGGSWRLVPATAGDGLILRAARRVDFPAPFQLAPGARSVAFTVAGGGARELRVSFFAQPVRPLPARILPAKVGR